MAKKNSKKKREERKRTEASVHVVLWLDHAMEALGKLQPKKRRELAMLLESFDWLQRF
jgi:hypothetical protein